jgi:Transposase DDE domain
MGLVTHEDTPPAPYFHTFWLYLQQDTLEAQANHPTAEELKAQRLQLQARKHHYEHLLQHLATSGASPISLTDADRRSMKTNQGTDVCSHGQLAGAQQHKLIVAHEVTNAVTDQDQLATMAIRAKDTLETDHLEAIADMGYDDGDEGKKCLDEGMVPYSPKPNTSANRKLGLFGKDDFAYAAQNDGDPCPAGQFLTFRFEAVEQGRHIRYYSTSACQRCLLKPPCTRNKENRRITRWVHESIMEDRQQRVIANPAKVR